VISSWILFFSYQDDARSNTHQICSRFCPLYIFTTNNFTVIVHARHQYIKQQCHTIILVPDY